jgi:CRP/FNR family transcriptional regulator, cyclic AMP receptor protein
VETSGVGPNPSRIQSLALFSSLSFEECVELAARTEVREFEPGHHVMHQGDGGYTFFVIESGTADVFVDDAPVRSLGPGDFMGELAILGAGYRTASVVATSPIELFALFGLEFRRLEEDHPELAEKIRKAMTERLR